MFWKKAARSAIWTSRYFRFLLLTRRAAILVAEEQSATVGLLAAMRARVPLVFDPGPTAFIGDFYVSSPDRWADVGQALYDRLRLLAGERGWTQLIIVSGTRDQPKNVFLCSVGLAETSSWWTGAA